MIIGGNLDVTERQAVEEELRHAQKMQAVGNLTAGIAHNFNNMLMAIQPSLELLEEVVPVSHLEVVTNAQHATARAADMVRQLMTFVGRRQAEKRTTCDLGRIVEAAIQICKRTFKRDIRIAIDCPQETLVSCDPGAIEQVLLNILINARDALYEARVEVPTIDIAVTRRRRGRDGVDLAAVTIRDNGPGMSSEVREQVFEPFFTTRTPNGTGLGLATSYAIVREHDGCLECSSALGEGSEFCLCLPVATKDDGLAQIAEPPEPRNDKSARILVVDDEPAIRSVVTMVLEDAGHQVICVDDAPAARELLESDSGFDVVLLDRSLPGGRGQELIPMLRSRLANAKILFFTGEHVDAGLDDVDGVIYKPVTGTQLRSAVSSALSESDD
jgi:CheY-like chemotaxis protein